MGKKRYSWDTRVAPKRVTVDSAPIMISGSAEHAWDSLSPFLSAPFLQVLSLSLSLSLSLKNKYINLKKKVSSTCGFGKTRQQPGKQNKNTNGSLSYNIHKNKPT